MGLDFSAHTHTFREVFRLKKAKQREGLSKRDTEKEGEKQRAIVTRTKYANSLATIVPGTCFKRQPPFIVQDNGTKTEKRTIAHLKM